MRLSKKHLRLCGCWKMQQCRRWRRRTTSGTTCRHGYPMFTQSLCSDQLQSLALERMHKSRGRLTCLLRKIIRSFVSAVQGNRERTQVSQSQAGRSPWRRQTARSRPHFYWRYVFRHGCHFSHLNISVANIANIVLSALFSETSHIAGENQCLPHVFEQRAAFTRSKPGWCEKPTIELFHILLPGPKKTLIIDCELFTKALVHF